MGALHRMIRGCCYKKTIKRKQHPLAYRLYKMSEVDQKCDIDDKELFYNSRDHYSHPPSVFFYPEITKTSHVLWSSRLQNLSQCDGWKFLADTSPQSSTQHTIRMAEQRCLAEDNHIREKEAIRHGILP